MSSSSDKFFLEKVRVTGVSAGSTLVVDLAILALAHLAIFITKSSIAAKDCSEITVSVN